MAGNWGPASVNSSLRAEKGEVFCFTMYSETGSRKGVNSSSSFAPIQAFSRLDDVHPQWGRQTCFPGPRDSKVNLIPETGTNRNNI